MKNFTRIVFFIKKFCFYLQKKNSFFKEVFSFALFTLFFGFLIGNLFGTFLNTIRSFILWDGLIIFLIILLMEFYNCFLYNRFFKNISAIPSTKFEEDPCCFFSNNKAIKRVPLAKKRSFLARERFPLFVLFSYKQNLFPNNQMIWKTINLLKIGLLFGFFIDAFKVGS